MSAHLQSDLWTHIDALIQRDQYELSGIHHLPTLALSLIPTPEPRWFAHELDTIRNATAMNAAMELCFQVIRSKLQDP